MQKSLTKRLVPERRIWYNYGVKQNYNKFKRKEQAVLSSVSNYNPKKGFQSTENDDLFEAQRKKAYHSRAHDLMRPHLSEVGSHRMETCGDWLWMLENSDGTKRKLEKGFFCGLRFCPACAWRYSLAWGRALCAVDRYLCDQKKLVPILVCLTIKNVRAEMLRSSIDRMARGWHDLLKLRRYSEWKNYARKTEVTYNRETCEYHPHFHIMLWVPKKYFKGTKFIKQEQLLEDWKAVMDMPEITQVDIRRAYNKDEKKQKCDYEGTSHSSAVAEVAKYVAKPADYTDENPAVFSGFYEGLRGVRIITLAGAAKSALQEFRKGNLCEFDPVQPDDLAQFTHRAIYHFHHTAGVYEMTSCEEIDLAEERGEAAWAKLERQRLLDEDIKAMQDGFTPMRDMYQTTKGATYKVEDWEQITEKVEKREPKKTEKPSNWKRILKKENERRERAALERGLAQIAAREVE